MRVLIVLLLAAACTGPPVATVTPGTGPSAPGSSPAALFGDGTHRVPEQVEPGTYRTLRPSDECYWTRLGGFSGGLGDLIASRISAGFEVATVQPTDAGFDSVGCGDWTNQLVQVTVTRSQFGEGTYIVGVDLDAGSYVATGGATCEWARLSGFGASDAEEIERGFAVEGSVPRAVVAATDAGFSSSGCGGWRPER